MIDNSTSIFDLNSYIKMLFIKGITFYLSCHLYIIFCTAYEFETAEDAGTLEVLSLVMRGNVKLEIAIVVCGKFWKMGPGPPGRPLPPSGLPSGLQASYLSVS